MITTILKKLSDGQIRKIEEYSAELEKARSNDEPNKLWVNIGKLCGFLECLVDLKILSDEEYTTLYYFFFQKKRSDIQIERQQDSEEKTTTVNVMFCGNWDKIAKNIPDQTMQMIPGKGSTFSLTGNMEPMKGNGAQLIRSMDIANLEASACNIRHTVLEETPEKKKSISMEMKLGIDPGEYFRFKPGTIPDIMFETIWYAADNSVHGKFYFSSSEREYDLQDFETPPMEIELTVKEQKFFRNKMEEYLCATYGHTLLEYLNLETEHREIARSCRNNQPTDEFIHKMAKYFVSALNPAGWTGKGAAPGTMKQYYYHFTTYDSKTLIIACEYNPDTKKWKYNVKKETEGGRTLASRTIKKLDDVSLVEQAIKYAVTGKKINEAYFHVKERR